MSDRISLICLLGLFVAACSSSSDGGRNEGQSEQPLVYVDPCTPAECDGLPVIEIGCAHGSPILTCEPNANGICHIEPTCSDSGDDGVVSYAPCDPSACGPLPQI